MMVYIVCLCVCVLSAVHYLHDISLCKSMASLFFSHLLSVCVCVCTHTYVTLRRGSVLKDGSLEMVGG